MKLSIQLVAWDGAEFIPSLFESLRKGIRNHESGIMKLLILDNASSDNTVELLKKELADFSIPRELIESKENLGFAGGHNALFNIRDRRYVIDHPEFVLLLNQDLYLEPDCIEKLLLTMEQHPDMAAVAPRLMRWSIDLDGLKRIQTDVIDSLGLKIFRSRRVVDDCAGQKWDDVWMSGNLKLETRNYSVAQEFPVSSFQFLPTFGVSGTCPMYRVSALRDVAFADGSIFDQSYGSYKEDVDLAWRLQSAGHKAGVVLGAVAYHARGSGQVLGDGDWPVMKNKRAQSLAVRKQSYRNHIATIYKNESIANLLLDLPWILWYELKKFAFFLLFDREVLTGIGEIWRMRKELAEKRRWIVAKRKMQWKELRMCWTDKKLEIRN